MLTFTRFLTNFSLLSLTDSHRPLSSTKVQNAVHFLFSALVSRFYFKTFESENVDTHYIVCCIDILKSQRPEDML